MDAGARHVLLEGEEDGDFVLEETDDYIVEEVGQCIPV